MKILVTCVNESSLLYAYNMRCSLGDEAEIHLDGPTIHKFITGTPILLSENSIFYILDKRFKERIPKDALLPPETRKTVWYTDRGIYNDKELSETEKYLILIDKISKQFGIKPSYDTIKDIFETYVIKDFQVERCANGFHRALTDIFQDGDFVISQRFVKGFNHKDIEKVKDEYDYVVVDGRLDHYFDYAYGELPYFRYEFHDEKYTQAEKYNAIVMAVTNKPITLSSIIPDYGSLKKIHNVSLRLAKKNEDGLPFVSIGESQQIVEAYHELNIHNNVCLITKSSQYELPVNRWKPQEIELMRKLIV